jgi:adenylate cyclase
VDELRGLLLAAGVSNEEVDAAERDGVLLALLADRFLLPGERNYTLDTAAVAAGMSAEQGRRLWRALGFPQPDTATETFSEDDVEVIRLLLRNSDAVTDYLLQEARVISASLRRVADVLVDEIWGTYRGDARTDTEAASAVAGNIDLERIERLLLHLLRRQLVASIYSRSALATRGSALAVGFVDLVGFTALSQQLDAGELGRLVERFEATCHDLIADAGARFVKGLGDGVLFTCSTADQAAAVALDLLDAVGDSVGPARAAVAYGPVIARDGDVYGPVVNLASRLVPLAEPQTVIAPAAPWFDGVPIGVRQVRGIGEVALVTLHRT